MVGLPSRTDRRDAMILSAALSNLEIEFVDGVLGEDVVDSAIPSLDESPRKLGNTSIGSWRAHMNAIQEFVYTARTNISTSSLTISSTPQNRPEEFDISFDLRR